MRTRYVVLVAIVSLVLASVLPACGSGCSKRELREALAEFKDLVERWDNANEIAECRRLAREARLAVTILRDLEVARERPDRMLLPSG